MTVRSILDAKGHQVMSVAPGAQLSAAVKLLGERKIGAVLVMEQGRMEGILSERDIVRVLSERGALSVRASARDLRRARVVQAAGTELQKFSIAMWVYTSFYTVTNYEEANTAIWSFDHLECVARATTPRALS